jgi:hypothetical protein
LKIGIIFSLAVLLFSINFLQFAIAFETEQEPSPPKIPEPIPAPEPIRMPEPEPIQEPFPGENESEKIQRLSVENDKLKQKNNNLQDQILILNNEKSGLQSKILELNDKIENLKEVIMEQVRIISDLANSLKGILFEKILSPIMNF